MLNNRISALMIGGLLVVPFSGAMAQEVAYAPPHIPSQYVVFMDSGTTRLPEAAADTIRSAAVSASGGTSMRTVKLVGRADYAQAVKTRLVQDGVPASSIAILPDSRPLASVGDGLKDTASRKVEIKL
ncbi:hypothetical protein BH11PSE3_BH11PSE3_07210 [soil metagenome]